MPALKTSMGFEQFSHHKFMDWELSFCDNVYFDH